MKRNYSLDLLRIISMLMIITMHFLGRGGFLSQSTGIYYIISYIIESFSLCAVNVFVLITGYFLIKKDNRDLKKIIKYFIQLWSIELIICIILKATNLYSFTGDDYIYMFMPFISKSNWFFNCYIILYLLHPYLNKLIHVMNKSDYKHLLIMSIIFFSIMQTFTPNVNWTLDTTGGYGIIWFIILYLCGAYINIYNNDSKLNRTKIVYFRNFIVFSGLIMIECYVMKKCNNWLIIPYDISNVYTYNNIFVFAAGVNLFNLFKNIKINNLIIQKIIRFNVPLVFGVSLIHSQRFLKEILWNKLLNVGQYINNSKMIISVICVVLLIYIICAFIEYLRIYIFDKLRLADYLLKIINKIKDRIKID